MKNHKEQPTEAKPSTESTKNPGTTKKTDIEQELRVIVRKYQQDKRKEYTVPAAPDTSKFREVVSGMVRLVKDFHSYTGYGIDFAYAIQVGTAIPLATRAAIREEVSKIPHEGYFFHYTYGTSFCLCGFVNTTKGRQR